MVNYDITTWHELGHQAMHRYSYYNGGEKESLVHMTLFAARLALEGDNDKSPVDPTGIDTSFMFRYDRFNLCYAIVDRVIQV